MDELDRNILGLLGADARMSVATLSRRLKVARSTIQARLERLETSGVIAGYTLKLGEGAREGRLRERIGPPMWMILRRFCVLFLPRRPCTLSDLAVTSWFARVVCEPRSCLRTGRYGRSHW